MDIKDAVLGLEAWTVKYGVGRITSIDQWRIGFTPYVAGYEMKFDPRNVKKITELYNQQGETPCH